MISPSNDGIHGLIMEIEDLTNTNGDVFWVIRCYFRIVFSGNTMGKHLTWGQMGL
jgi:hypothetical protein